MDILFLPIANYPQFILNQYQEVGQKRAHTATPKYFFLNLCNMNVFNGFPNKPLFLRVCSISLLKTLSEKEKLLVTSNFSFSHSVFYPFVELSPLFHEVYKCRLQSLSNWKSLNFVVWERIKVNVTLKSNRLQ